MKKALLILAIAAGSALQASAQTTQITVPNGGFEAGTVGDTNSMIQDWKTTGNVKLVSKADFVVGGQPQTQTAYDMSSKFIEVRARKQDSGNLYTRGTIRQSIGIPTSTSVQARPTYFQFNMMYVPGSQADIMAVQVAFTMFDWTTGGHDTIGSALAYTNPNSFIYPWGKFGVQMNWKRNDRPDSVHIVILSNAAGSLSPNSVLYVDDFRFEDRSVTGINWLGQPMDGQPSVYPNPMTTNATISYQLNQNSNVNVELYDLNGRMVQNVFSGDLAKGEHKNTIQRNNLTPGLYIYKIQAGSQVQTGKVMITE
jgi:hypothetical protein